jgi:hypothetical protein
MRNVFAVSMVVASILFAGQSWGVETVHGIYRPELRLADGDSSVTKRPQIQLADGDSSVTKRPQVQLADGDSSVTKRPQVQLADAARVPAARRLLTANVAIHTDFI